MDSRFALTILCDCLTDLPPLELKAMGLLREQPQLFGTAERLPRADLIAAVTEIVAYTDCCQTAAHRLTSLAPVPLSIPFPEFAL